MKWKIERLTAVAAAFVLMVGLASTASAQVFTGRVDVTIEDATGGRLPGVNVDLTGPVIQSQATDAQGQAHFLNLPVGTYSLKAALSGFNGYTNNVVEVVSGASTPVAVKLAVAGTAETVNVEAATPVIDVKRDTTTTNVTLEELQNIPSARDPWVVMQTVPTVYMDRVNVGGAESGQQSNYNAKGAKDTDNTWAIDGVPITDMGATGSSAFYYNFDSFQEMAITTGGADAQNATGGVQLNMVLKKGTNAMHGNASYYFENQKLQGNNLNADLLAIAVSRGNKTGKGNRIDKYQDRGFDLGGPLLKDKLWIWGQVAQTNIDLRDLANNRDATIFKTRALKVDGQASNNIRGNFTWYYNDKQKFGRNVGATRPPETAWNQSGLGGGTKYMKGEGNFVIGQKVFASVKAAHVKGGFQLVPVGGLDKDYYQDADGVYHNSYYQYQSARPQNYVGGDASYFAGKHEIKFGGDWRSTPVDTQQIWPASHLVALDNQGTYPLITVQAARNYRSLTEAKYVALYLTDTISLDRLTVIGGIRFGHATSGLGAATVPAVPGIPALPALNAPAVKNVYDFKNVTPRIGLTYALDKSRKTLLRTSYAMFTSQLPGSQSSFVSPIQYSYAYYNAIDRNGDHLAQLSEVITTGGIDGKGLQYTYGFDVANQLKTANKVDPNIKSPLTHEVLVGLDRELMPNVGFSSTFTWRRMNDLLWTPLLNAKFSDFKQTGTLTGNVAEVGAFSVPFYGQTATDNPGQLSANRGGYHQKYLGLEMSLQKRMANHWMARFGFSTNKWTEYFTDPAKSIVDPTKAPASYVGHPWSSAQSDGGVVVRSSSGSGKSGIYLVAPTYQLVANGMYEAPLGLSFGLNMTMRQGYAEPFYRSSVSAGDLLGRKRVLIVKNVDDFRLPKVVSADARIEWKLKLMKTSVAVDLDVFNFLNSDVVLGKQYDARLTGPTGYGKVLEIINPRVARLGVRLFF